ncbi:hypothetical protein MJO29_015706 [Puccinia striiformis f. sp. tritici]|nr:hypothetical protein MJO29_015706 [Puccinia striiformis f. sp. tritici]
MIVNMPDARLCPKDVARYRHLEPIYHLFSNEFLCSSDESSCDKKNKTRPQHAPVWQSLKATALVEYVDPCGWRIISKGPK